MDNSNITKMQHFENRFLINYNVEHFYQMIHFFIIFFEF